MTLKTILFSSSCFALAVFMYANPAKATDRNQLAPKATATSQSNAAAAAFAGASAGASVTNSTSVTSTQNNASQGGSVDINQERTAASSAIAPSVGTNNDCLIATPSSLAGSILIFSGSGTTGYHYSGLCLAYKMQNYELAEQLMCLQDANFRKLNAKCENK